MNAGTPREPLDPLAWAALVARWVEVARASRAIPPSDERLRRSIAPVIAVEATTAALGELASIPEADRPHARAIAELSIRRAAGELDALWRGEEWPEEVARLFADAERALRLAAYAGLEELVVVGEGALEVPDLVPALAPGRDEIDAAGTLALMPPGSLAMPGEPVAWWCGRAAPACDEPRLVRRVAAMPRQVYRSLDDRGRFVEDLVTPIEDAVEAGLPMLVPILADGARVGRLLHAAGPWRAMQRAALDGRDAIPVRHAEPTGT